MDALLREYLPILIFFGIAFGLSLVMVLASLIVGRQRPDPEKLSAYERSEERRVGKECRL